MLHVEEVGVLKSNVLFTANICNHTQQQCFSGARALLIQLLASAPMLSLCTPLLLASTAHAVSCDHQPTSLSWGLETTLPNASHPAALSTISQHMKGAWVSISTCACSYPLSATLQPTVLVMALQSWWKEGTRERKKERGRDRSPCFVQHLKPYC